MPQAVVAVIWFAIIAIVIGSKLKRAMSQFEENKPTFTGDDGRTRPQPIVKRRPNAPQRPASVDELLGQLQERMEQAARPQARPVVRPKARVTPVPVKVIAKPAEPPSLPAKSYLGEESIEAAYDAAIAREREGVKGLMGESISVAFPQAQGLTSRTYRGARPAILVRLSGRRSLRQGILMSEILGPPRAFDV